MSASTVAMPYSCDTFVALSSATADGSVIFAKNSDRPASEVQEVVFLPSQDHDLDTKVKCTYIEISQVPHTHAVLLSKPAWIWGAEMAANEHGVCIGNEAVWTKLSGPHDLDKKLIGMDFVRLGVERSQTAKEALDVISALLDHHGQGGPCSVDPDHLDFCYNNSFLIVDQSEAWVLETAGHLWAAERITSGVRNISNFLTIGTRIDAMAADLIKHAEQSGYWKPEHGQFDFAKAYSGPLPKAFSTADVESPANRYKCGKELMEKMAGTKSVTPSAMFSLLRDDTTGICRGVVNPGVQTTGSMVSVLHHDSTRVSSHWLTATPDPRTSVYKPFVFCAAAQGSPLVVSPKTNPADHRHQLYRVQRDCHDDILPVLRSLEATCIDDVGKFTRSGTESDAELATLFVDAVEAEIKLRQKYKAA